jgi:DNA-binding PadR family transcriptional regulator
MRLRSSPDGDFRHEYREHRHRDDHGERDGHGRDHHRRGRRSGRLFDHGELRLVVLALISERPRHGYEIIKEIEDRVAGTYTPSPGVIYPTLIMLEELGHATVTESEGKKLYAVTTEGSAYLAANRTAVDNALQRMQSVNSAHSGGPAPDIMRARCVISLQHSMPPRSRSNAAENRPPQLAGAIASVATVSAAYLAGAAAVDKHRNAMRRYLHFEICSPGEVRIEAATCDTRESKACFCAAGYSITR